MFNYNFKWSSSNHWITVSFCKASNSGRNVINKLLLEFWNLGKWNRSLALAEQIDHCFSRTLANGNLQECEEIWEVCLKSCRKTPFKLLLLAFPFVPLLSSPSSLSKQCLYPQISMMAFKVHLESEFRRQCTSIGDCVPCSNKSSKQKGVSNKVWLRKFENIRFLRCL